MENSKNNYEKIIRDAQYRKGLSIAYFNSLNAAIELVKVELGEMGSGVRDLEEGYIRNAISLWRDWFLEEHKEYYATVIASLGVNYDRKESIKQIKAAKNLEGLKNVWLLFSEDERQDDEIIKVKNETKKKYEKA